MPLYNSIHANGPEIVVKEPGQLSLSSLSDCLNMLSFQSMNGIIVKDSGQLSSSSLSDCGHVVLAIHG